MANLTPQDGNVIAADFGKPALGIEIRQQILYQDDRVILFRVSYSLGSQECLPPQHIMLELE